MKKGLFVVFSAALLSGVLFAAGETCKALFISISMTR
jgi:hypothetical protein